MCGGARARPLAYPTLPPHPTHYSPLALQDPYGNYVVQSALSVTKGPLHAELVDRIRPHFAAIKSSPFGKRILARSNLLGRSFGR